MYTFSQGAAQPPCNLYCSCEKNWFHKRLSCFVICLDTMQVTGRADVLISGQPLRTPEKQLEPAGPLVAGPPFFGKSNFISTNMHKWKQTQLSLLITGTFESLLSPSLRGGGCCCCCRGRKNGLRRCSPLQQRRPKNLVKGDGNAGVGVGGLCSTSAAFQEGTLFD